MTVHNLDKIFNPASIALIGVNGQEGSVGWNLLQNLLRGGYEGPIMPVTSSCSTLGGVQAYKSLSAIGQAVDLVVISDPSDSIVSIIEECIHTGAGGAILVSAYGTDILEEKPMLGKAVREKVAGGSLRLIGPNSLGVIRPRIRLNASLARHMPAHGKLAFISQSRALCAAIIDLSIEEQIGFSHFISIGSMLDVDFGDMVDYLGNDPEVSSIVLCIRALTGFRKFMSAARAVSLVKPIVVLKSGSCAPGLLPDPFQPESPAWEDAVYAAAFRRAGIVQVNTIEELFDCAELAAKQPRPAGPGLAIVSNGSGPGIMARDALTCHGLEPLVLGEETIHELDKVLPLSWSRSNPINILEDATPLRYRQVLEICLAASEINALLVILTPHSAADATSVAATLVDLLRGKTTPVFTVWLGAAEVRRGRAILNAAGIPTYETPERAIGAFLHMYSYNRNLELLTETPPRLARVLKFDRESARALIGDSLEPGRKYLTEIEAKALLGAYGIPTNKTLAASSPEEALKAAQEIGYPVVLKPFLQGMDAPFRDKGSHLDLRSEEEVLTAYRAILEQADPRFPKRQSCGVSVQRMIKPSLFEIMIGAVKDTHFGPVIFFGAGGALSEIARDRSLALPPLNRLLARRLMEETRIYNLLKGYYSLQPAYLGTLEEVLIRLSQLVADLPEIEKIIINPLIVSSHEIYAVGVQIAVSAASVPPFLHLVISPYPNQYETYWTMKDGTTVFIRPIKPEDEPMLREFIHSLSRKSLYFRFFGFLRLLPHRMLARLTQLDYDRDMALIALLESEGKEKIIGVGRLMHLADGLTREFAIVVGDAWQGKGLGSRLMELCIAVAREQGVRTIWAKTLAENETMLSLARKFGFTIKSVAGTDECEMLLNLEPPSPRT
jgi:acetyltransferase